MWERGASVNTWGEHGGGGSQEETRCEAPREIRVENCSKRSDQLRVNEAFPLIMAQS